MRNSESTDEVEARLLDVIAFAEGPSAAGFVGWLHTHPRVSGHTGAIVICGKDRRDTDALFRVCQGVMDYWACPLPAADRFLDVIRSLIGKGRAAR